MPDLVITFTVQQAARYATAIGQAQGLGRDATPAEVKAFDISIRRQFVQQQEYIRDQNQITSTPFDPT